MGEITFIGNWSYLKASIKYIILISIVGMALVLILPEIYVDSIQFFISLFMISIGLSILYIIFEQRGGDLNQEFPKNILSLSVLILFVSIINLLIKSILIEIGIIIASVFWALMVINVASKAIKKSGTIFQSIILLCVIFLLVLGNQTFDLGFLNFIIFVLSVVWLIEFIDLTHRMYKKTKNL